MYPRVQSTAMAPRHRRPITKTHAASCSGAPIRVRHSRPPLSVSAGQEPAAPSSLSSIRAEHNLARSADCWLRVRPGSDAALALAMIHVLIEEKLFDEAFVRDWTTGPFLVRDDTQTPAYGSRPDVRQARLQSFVVWDTSRGTPACQLSRIKVTRDSDVAAGARRQFLLSTRRGRFGDMPTGLCAACRASRAIRARTLGVDHLGRSRSVFGGQRDFSPPNCRPATSPGLGSKCTATPCRLNRAVCCLYALTGQFDERGSNVLIATTAKPPVEGPQLLPEGEGGDSARLQGPSARAA